MASRAASHWRSMMNQLGGKRSFATSTSPKMKPTTLGVSALTDAEQKVLDKSDKWATIMNGENAPIMMVAGMVAVAIFFATHTAKQQLMHAPAVSIRKSKRESVLEVEDPDAVISSSDKFINKSYFRKIAHIQGDTSVLPDSSRQNPYTASRNPETLKSVGVEPSGHY